MALTTGWGRTVLNTLTVAAILPYGIAIFLYHKFGWPTTYQGGKLAGLHPQKVFKLNYAAMQWFVVGTIQNLPLYFTITRAYRTARPESLIKSIPFGRHNCLLDLHLPHPVPGRPLPPKMPVYIFVFGGAWTSGSRTLYCMLANQLADKLQSVVVVPDYPLWPEEQHVHAMQTAIIDSVAWTYKNIEKYSGDKMNIHLMGHSAGAHLSVLAPMALAQGDYSPLDDNTTSSTLLPAIRKVLGFSGVYDITDHYKHEEMRGVADVSPMHRVMGGPDNFHLWSPSVLVDVLAEKDLISRLPPMYLFHGTADHIVPYQSTVKLGERLAKVNGKAVVKIFPGVGHSEPVTDVMLPDRPTYDLIMGCIMETAKDQRNQGDQEPAILPNFISG
ncbi:PREDICTED: probable isoprenylcysteine alpha-carbonyl methylesterase ICMEL1 [Branchiostoma belcheri]|uniref:Probable isoprenylcysteine alpha-carbonyl methylesterase ICMEL1 n=1 Tax=Branchiostoma belcheri TaxID=7741 RepID=A0A6P4XTL1_BRABE|nr:PREDICTED: probable isoprenylcysteine alpha-carbonyl methylesterase ICMEL1 [Branchiostoma belcheri]